MGALALERLVIFKPPAVQLTICNCRLNGATRFLAVGAVVKPAAFGKFQNIRKGAVDGLGILSCHGEISHAGCVDQAALHVIEPKQGAVSRGVLAFLTVCRKFVDGGGGGLSGDASS